MKAEVVSSVEPRSALNSPRKVVLKFEPKDHPEDQLKRTAGDPTVAPASPSVPVVEGAPGIGCYQCLRPQGELQLPPASLGDAPRPAGEGRSPDIAVCRVGLQHPLHAVAWKKLQNSNDIRFQYKKKKRIYLQKIMGKIVGPFVSGC